MNDAHVIRTLAAGYFMLGISGIVVGAAARDEWPSPGTTWSNAFLIAGAAALCGAPYVWELAERRARRRSSKLVLILSTALHTLVVVAAITGAIGNVRDEWMGGVAWTVGLLLLAVYALLGLSNDVTRLAREHR